MIIEVCFDLRFGFFDEPKAAPIAGQGGCAPIAKLPAYHTGVRQAAPAAEFGNALRAPGKMVVLFFGGLEQMLLRCGRRANTACPLYSACAATSPA